MTVSHERPLNKILENKPKSHVTFLHRNSMYPERLEYYPKHGMDKWIFALKTELDKKEKQLEEIRETLKRRMPNKIPRGATVIPTLHKNDVIKILKILNS